MAVFCYVVLAEPITLLYNERVPYLVTSPEGDVSGLTATPATEAFQKANIDYAWEKVPSKRQMNRLKSNAKRECAIGWFKNPDRETFAKYTKAIYQDKPTVGLALFSNTLFKENEDLSEVLANKQIRLLVKDGYSYGKYIDTIIARHHPNLIKTTAENLNMLAMLYVDRGDFMFVSAEEADSLIQASGHRKEEFKFIHFNGMPQGNKRYILCSQKVEDSVIESLNRVLP